MSRQVVNLGAALRTGVGAGPGLDPPFDAIIAEHAEFEVCRVACHSLLQHVGHALAVRRHDVLEQPQPRIAEIVAVDDSRHRKAHDRFMVLAGLNPVLRDVVHDIRKAGAVFGMAQARLTLAQHGFMMFPLGQIVEITHDAKAAIGQGHPLDLPIIGLDTIDVLTAFQCGRSFP